MILLLVFASKWAQLTLNILPKGVKNWEESESLTQSGQVPTSNLSPVSQSATEVLQILFSTNCSRKEDGALTGGGGGLHISHHCGAGGQKKSLDGARSPAHYRL